MARVFLTINKKRGYKSSRKAKNEDEGQAIDGMEAAKRLYEENLTPGQLVYQLLNEGKKNIPDFNVKSVLNRITELYKPVKNGDLYTLNYMHSSQTLTLSLNQKTLGQIQNDQANQYFKIWLGSQPFNAKLKQQLLN